MHTGTLTSPVTTPSNPNIGPTATSHGCDQLTDELSEIHRLTCSQHFMLNSLVPAADQRQAHAAHQLGQLGQVVSFLILSAKVQLPWQWHTTHPPHRFFA